MRVAEDLLLDDNRLFVFVHVFDRVFNGDNLATTLAVDKIHHVIQRGRLSSASGAADEHKPVWLAHEVVDLRGKAELLAGVDAVPAESEAEFRLAVAPVNRDAQPPGNRMME